MAVTHSTVAAGLGREISASDWDAVHVFDGELPTYTLATMPDPAAGLVIYVSDAGRTDGLGVVAFSDGSGWFSLVDGSLVGSTPNITITPPTLPNAVNGVAYSQTIVATGGTAPYTYIVDSGTLPPGLSLNASSGAITGTPTMLGSYNFTIRATDANNVSDTNAYTVATAIATVTPTVWTDTAVTIDRTTYYETSALARVVLTTSATSITVNGYCNIFATYPEFAEIGVIVDGVFLQSVIPTATGMFSQAVALVPGSKTIELVNGAQTKIGGSGDVLGTFLTSVTANDAITQTFPAATNVTLFLADSIGVGANAEKPTQYSYIARLRNVTTDSLVVYGWGFNQMDSIAGDVTKRTAMMAIISALAPTRIVDTLGTNDWALSSSTPSQLATKKAALYDLVHAALPSTTIYSVKIILRDPDAITNGLGVTPDDMRAAVDTAASGRGWVTVVNGKAFMAAGNLADGVHPSTYGHLLWAQGIDGSLGYTVPDDPLLTAPMNAGPDVTGTVTDLGSSVYRIEKTSGTNGFNTGFYSEPRAGDFRYQLDYVVQCDIMIGINSTPATESGYADMLHQLYPTAGGGMAEYAGGSYIGSLGPQGGGTAGRLWVDRTGTTVTFKMGATYAGASTLITVNSVSGDYSLDMSMYQVGGKYDVTVVI